MCTSPCNAINNVIATLTTGDISQAKSALLMLHFLFPHELLPALDLLDRKLVSRTRILEENGEVTENEVYYVQSASATSSRPSRNYTTTTVSYEVRLSAWNCTCPAFAYSAFGKTCETSLDLDNSSGINQVQDHTREEGKVRFGGTLTHADSGLPICKHILAAFLGTIAPQIFGHGVATENVSRSEAAGWAGGWAN